VAEHRLSLAVNGQENLLHQRLITYRAGVGLENGRQPTAGSVAIVGLGYVGLPTAVALHGAARRIIGIDSNEQRLRDILAQDADLGGPDQERLAAALTDGSLELTTDPAAAKVADAVIICVPTPVDSQQTPDLSALRAACGTVVRHARPGQLIVLTSTSYVGTTRDLLTGTGRPASRTPRRLTGTRTAADHFPAVAHIRGRKTAPPHPETSPPSPGVPTREPGAGGPTLERGTSRLLHSGLSPPVRTRRPGIRPPPGSRTRTPAAGTSIPVPGRSTPAPGTGVPGAAVDTLRRMSATRQPEVRASSPG